MEHLRCKTVPAAAGGLRPWGLTTVILFGLTLLLSSIRTVDAASHWETQKLFFAGQYAECERISRQEVQRGVWNEQWPQLLIRCLLTRGKYDEAREAYESALDRYANRLTLRLLGHEVYRMVDEPQQARDQLQAIYRLVSRSPWRYSSSRDQVALGRFFAIQGEDSRQILELVYDRVRERNPEFKDVYVATAELALAKHDYQLAAKNVEIAIKLDPDDPYPFFLQAQAWRDTDSQKADESLQQALQLNPRHVPSLLMQVDHLIAAEHFDQAAEVLEKVLEVNRFQPEAWAYHAVIAHLHGHYQGEHALRQVAMSTWSSNHYIDHLIGRELSEKYRFADGAKYQRRSLILQNDFLPAQFQLAQDLLRLGEDEEGWRLASQVQDRDQYHVVAFNLMSLKDELDRYRTLTDDGFILRMEAAEAELYGGQVLNLLREAKETLCDKYDVLLGDEPVVVEIFPRQQDFAIRTFGLPGGAGYLGVCFGRVITANSPASQGNSPANWQAVLWHEFCHVVTLTKTQNRMPRWLSEGISVYEERQRDSAWGQRMTPQFHQMICKGQVTPVSQLSGAFLRPSSPVHLQFAYFESSLVVEFLIEEHGIETLKRILVDLGVGMPIDEALRRYVAPPDVLDQQFDEFIKQRAAQYAPQLDFEREVMPERPTASEIALLLAQHPNNYWLLRTHAAHLVEARRWEEALEVLKSLREKHPRDSTSGNATALLADVYRNLGNEEAEYEMLAELAAVDDDAIDIYVRLMEIDRQQQRWESLLANARKLLAVNPLMPHGHEMLGKAAAELGLSQELLDARRALLQLDPADPAKAHYELAVALQQLSQTQEAKRQVLMALDAAPRYRDAQRLLLQLIDDPSELPESKP